MQDGPLITALRLWLSDALRDGLAQGSQVGRRERAHRTHDETLHDGRHHRFQHGRLDESGRLPLGDRRIAEGMGYRHSLS